MSDELDRMLANPLAPVNDNGFSERVAQRISAHERFAALTEWALLIAGVVLLVSVVPLAGVLNRVASATVELSQSLPFAVACAALALSMAAMRALAD